MATFKDLQTTVADFLNRDLGDTSKRAILRAIELYQHERGWYNETSTALTCTANSAYLLPPDDYWELDRLEIRLYGQWIGLVERDFDTVRVMNSLGLPGQPTFYAYRANKWELTMIPDSAYPVMCYYMQALPALSADTDSNVWTNEGFNLIAHEATFDLMANTLQVDDAMKLQSQSIKRDQALARFHELIAQRGVSRILPTRF